MTNIKAVVQNQGKNHNGEVAFNILQIRIDNEVESCIPDIYKIHDCIRKIIGYVGIPFRKSWYGQGVSYWFNSGIVFESECSMILSIKELEKDLLDNLYESFPEHEMVKNRSLSIKVTLFNSQYEN